jgi:ribosomal protein S18 acetylase RimI-like enzyme
MLRPFRARDGPILQEMLLRNFPEEQRILEKDAAGIGRVVRRVYRWDARLALGLLSLLGRPVFRLFVIEADRRAVATALLSFGTVSGYVSVVMVDPGYRGRGFARRLLAESVRATRRARRTHVVLDVLEQNAPARRLYESIGFRPIRTQSMFVRQTFPTNGGAPALRPAELRKLRRSDGAQLFALAQSTLPGAVAEVMPAHPRQFYFPMLVEGFFAQETEAWVVGGRGHPQGFLRVTHDPTSRAGHLSAPLFGPELSDELIDRSLAAAVSWFEARGVPRVVSQVPDHAPRAGEALTRAGFQPELRLLTLRLDLAAT